MIRRNKYGAKKVKEADGTTSDSKLESYLKRQFDLFKIPYQQQVPFVLVDKFDFHGEKVRAMTYKLDFLVGREAIECKGFMQADAKLKHKLFKFNYKATIDAFHVVSNRKECDALVLLLIEKGLSLNTKL